jgi:secreted Zn-dependent insulinase-like peptidase
LIHGAKKILGLPPANKLIPKNFGIKASNPKLSAKPSLIKQWADTDLWYMKDDKFERPKCKVSMKLYTNDCGLGFNAESRVFAHVWTRVLDEYMREFNYMATCANMSFSVTPHFENVEFNWQGFDDSMPVYIKETLNKLVNMKDEHLLEIFD